MFDGCYDDSLLLAAAVALILFVFCREIAPTRARDESHASNPRSSRTKAGRVVRRAITWVVRNVMIAKTEIATIAKILLGFVQVNPGLVSPKAFDSTVYLCLKLPREEELSTFAGR